MKLGRNVDSIVERYKKFVKPCHETYVLPVRFWWFLFASQFSKQSRKFADIIIPNFGSSVCEELEAFNKNKDNKDTKGKGKVSVEIKLNKILDQPSPKVNLALELMVEQVKSHLEELNQIRVFQQKI